MRRITWAALSAACLALVAVPVAAQEPQMAATQDVVLTATVVDTSCRLVYGLTGEMHRECAQVCADRGITLGLLASDGTYYAGSIDVLSAHRHLTLGLRPQHRVGRLARHRRAHRELDHHRVRLDVARECRACRCSGGSLEAGASAPASQPCSRRHASKAARVPSGSRWRHGSPPTLATTSEGVRVVNHGPAERLNVHAPGIERDLTLLFLDGRAATPLPAGGSAWADMAGGRVITFDSRGLVSSVLGGAPAEGPPLTRPAFVAADGTELLAVDAGVGAAGRSRSPAGSPPGPHRGKAPPVARRASA
jgi:hypothetical protein